jgi:hypothetical protein
MESKIKYTTTTTTTKTNSSTNIDPWLNRLFRLFPTLPNDIIQDVYSSSKDDIASVLDFLLESRDSEEQEQRQAKKQRLGKEPVRHCKIIEIELEIAITYYKEYYTRDYREFLIEVWDKGKSIGRTDVFDQRRTDVSASNRFTFIAHFY